MNSINRRRWLQSVITASGGVLAAQWKLRGAAAADFPQPVPEAAGLTAYLRDGTLLVRNDNLPVAVYRSQSDLKYPYLAPLNGPVSGLPLTTESALPYPHHRGAWLGCDPVNGGNYWADDGLESGHIRSLELDLGDVTERTVSFHQRCVWERADSSPLEDERHYAVTIADERRTFIDCKFHVVAKEDISITNAKHSFFALRAAADISPSYGGTLINSRGGTGAEGTYGKPAEWCGYFGPRRLRPDVVEGIVFMNHPENFGGDCPWFTREYGHLSCSPFNFLDEPWTLERGATLDLAYRVVLFAGTPDEAGLDAVYESWLRA